MAAFLLRRKPRFGCIYYYCDAVPPCPESSGSGIRIQMRLMRDNTIPADDDTRRRLASVQLHVQMGLQNRTDHPAKNCCDWVIETFLPKKPSNILTALLVEPHLG